MQQRTVNFRILRNFAKQRHVQRQRDSLCSVHFAPADVVGIQAVDNHALRRQPLFAQDARRSLRVADAYIVRRADQHALVDFIAQQTAQAALNARRRINENVVEIAFERPQNFAERLGFQLLRAGELAGGQERQIRQRVRLRHDKRIIHRANAVRDIQNIIHNAILHAQQHILIAQADIRIHNADALAVSRNFHAEAGGEGAFAHSAFAGSNNPSCTHVFVQALLMAQGCCQSAGHSPHHSCPIPGKSSSGSPSRRRNTWRRNIRAAHRRR